MIIRATFDANGLPTAFYPEDIWPSGYPSGATKLTEDQWHEFLDNQGMRRWHNGQVLEIDPPEPEPAPERVFSFLEFMDLFTAEEQMALAGAAMSDVTIKLWYDRAMGAQGILMSDPRTRDGVQIMVATGLLTEDRGAQVLRGEVP